MGKLWSDQARARDRDRKADERDHRRRQRATAARQRREWIKHPIRTAWRSR